MKRVNLGHMSKFLTFGGFIVRYQDVKHVEFRQFTNLAGLIKRCQDVKLVNSRSGQSFLVNIINKEMSRTV